MQDTIKQKNVSKGPGTGLFLKWLFFGLFMTLVLLSIQCASVQAPLGGPKDSLPPVLLSESPKNLTRNFNAEKIILGFDEFIKLTNEFKEISVSPDMERLPLFKAKRRNLEITIQDSLEENTTYTINFGKAITDYNEGNAVLNYSYVFSTGDEIDSLSVSGNVKNAVTLENEMQINVLLIPTRQDSIFGKRKANIFTLTDSSGNFRFRNLREDTYRIYALKEQNNDRIYNSQEELIGFLDDTIHLAKDTSGIKLRIFRETPKNFRIADRRIEKDGRISLFFNRPLASPEIHIVSPEELDSGKITEFSKTNDTLFMWLPELSFDSLKVKIHEADTLLDSITMRRGRNDKYERDILIADNISGRKVDRVRHIQLTASSPVSQIDRSKIKLLEDSISRTNYQLVRDTSNVRRYILRYNWRPKRDYRLEFDEGVFKGIGNATNKKSAMDFTLNETENYGDVIMKASVPDSTRQYVIELISHNKETIFSSVPITGAQTVSFRQYPGAKYLIRVIYDLNGNGKWDTGYIYAGVPARKLKPITDEQRGLLRKLPHNYVMYAGWFKNE